MFSSTLRSVGGSVMMAIPKPVLEELRLSANAKVDLAIEDGRLVVRPRPRPKYTLAELLAQCDLDAPMSAEERAWDEAEAVGREVL